MFLLDQAGNLKIRWNLVLYARLITQRKYHFVLIRFKTIASEGCVFLKELRRIESSTYQAHMNQSHVRAINYLYCISQSILFI